MMELDRVPEPSRHACQHYLQRQWNDPVGRADFAHYEINTNRLTISHQTHKGTALVSRASQIGIKFKKAQLHRMGSEAALTLRPLIKIALPQSSTKSQIDQATPLHAKAI